MSRGGRSPSLRVFVFELAAVGVHIDSLITHPPGLTRGPWRGDFGGVRETPPSIHSNKHTNYLDKTSDSLHQQGWSYGLVRYKDLATGEELHQIDAHKGDRGEKGRTHLD